MNIFNKKCYNFSLHILNIISISFEKNKGK